MTFTNEEYEEFKETIGLITYEFIILNIKKYINPQFHESVIKSIVDMIMLTINDIVLEYDKNELISTITTLVEESLKIFYKNICPPRSYNNTFIRLTQLDSHRDFLRRKLNYLKNVPQPQQRTPEWYEFRYNHLTASNIWKTFYSNSTRNQLIFEKCKPHNSDKYKKGNLSLDSPLHWGQKYEPLSALLYEKMYNTTVSDFGCIPHNKHNFLAASPDGINTLETSNRYGRMVEIKNIYNRLINGIPKLEYWVQMQIQLEVCDLNECDFFETRFKEYNDKDEFEKDTSTQPKGIIILFMNEDGQPIYEYGPLHLSDSLKIENWEESIMNKNNNYTWIKNIYWKLDEYSCVLVLRNKMWYSSIVSDLKEIWNIIEEEKKTGNYIHRSPKKTNKPIIKKNTQNSNNDINITMNSTCLIDI